jgi:magnesium-dependent phosphatase 1
MLSLLKLDTSSLPGGKVNVRGIDFFDEMEIYPGSKTTHFQSLQKKTGIDYRDMLFFDDEARNRNVERELGVLMILVPDGTNNEDFDRGVREWRKRNVKSRAISGGQGNLEDV